MNWTTEKPTKPGWYLMIYPNDIPVLVNLFWNERLNKDGQHTLRIKDRAYIGSLGNINEGDCQWWGPIEEPQP